MSCKVSEHEFVVSKFTGDGEYAVYTCDKCSYSIDVYTDDLWIMSDERNRREGK